MLRNSFLMNHDYLFNRGIAEIVLKYYDPLAGISVKELQKDKSLESLENLELEIRDYYYKMDSTICITDTLMTKILLGTLGGVPVYDVRAKRTLKEIKESCEG